MFVVEWQMFKTWARAICPQLQSQLILQISSEFYGMDFDTGNVLPFRSEKSGRNLRP
jgi:hypothetical protein